MSGRGGKGKGFGKGKGKGKGSSGKGGGRGGGKRYFQKGGGKDKGSGGSKWAQGGQSARLDGGRGLADWKKSKQIEDDKRDASMGFLPYAEGEEKIGWLLNMLSCSVDDEDGKEMAALELFFLEPDGGTFKARLVYQPYFYVGLNATFTKEVITLMQRKFEGQISSIDVVQKEDLDMPNHLSGKMNAFLKLSFRNTQDQMDVRRVVLPAVERNKSREKAQRYAFGREDEMPDDFMECLTDIREYDVQYDIRVSIDMEVRVGAWYTVQPVEGNVIVKWQKQMLDKAEPLVLAFDIECSKAPLKFPDAAVDEIYMISYMLGGEGFLIISRSIVSEDVEDFEYTPKPDYPGHFTVFNEVDEKASIKRFFTHIQEAKPHIFVTYNGDFFDWPFLEQRATHYGINMTHEIGVSANSQGEYIGHCSVHMDCFCWVKRDSYLPNGSQGLKAVTRYKLFYDPVEVDPEDMLPLAMSNPQHMAAYSVSDAVATWYLYEKYVHLFVFSLCTIIPLSSESVLRKGSGTLCESLLMVEAFRGNIICPNKQKQEHEKFFENHPLESETYIGGHVECLETGVYRNDIPIKFRLVPEAFQGLIDNIDFALTFALENESGIQRSDVVNYDEVRNEIVEKLELLRDTPLRMEEPTVYHLDVAAMYPNIILSNRLQPCAIVTQADCAACDFNREENGCRRPMEWIWRGDHYPATRSEHKMLKMQLEVESFEVPEYEGGPLVTKPYHDLHEEKKRQLLTQRLKSYCQTVYKKSKVTKEQVQTSTTCMRENPFYVNTVRDFRDRRYEYKLATKDWKKKASALKKAGDLVGAKAADNTMQVFDSLQTAHKCILNSFYGYVMRRGARWYSMPMAGIVTYTGSMLIQQARQLVEQIGRPLELDTDGIWCVLPASFPENFVFKTNDGKKTVISYPCVMLNADVHENYTNHQYQDLVNPPAVVQKGDGTVTTVAGGGTRRYATKSECSIYFEVDGPYRCMVLPASTEEGKLLKKRYAVFNQDGSLAELKGFELKRRGELQLIKLFQGQIFEQFLNGSNLAECYASVAEHANHWLDILDSQGDDMEDEDLLELLSENRMMSKALEEYGDTKSTSTCTARRLGEFLGDEMVKDKGLACKMIISSKPGGAPVSERAIPVAIFQAEEAVRHHFLRKWCKDSGMTDFDIRNIIDWPYYRERLAKAIQKIITIPAALQKVDNPVPRVQHPDWLAKMVREKNDRFQQRRLTSMFTVVDPAEKLKEQQNIFDADADGSPPKKLNAGADMTGDIEDMGGTGQAKDGRPVVHMKNRNAIRRRAGKGKSRAIVDEDDEEEEQQPTEMATADAQAQEANADGESAEVEEPVEEVPKPELGVDDFKDWIVDRKQRWKKLRVERKRLRNEVFGGETNNFGGGPGSMLGKSRKGKRKQRQAGVQGFMQQARDAVAFNHWQVIEIREGDEPGMFNIYAMTSQKTLQRIPVLVDRKIYVNTRRPFDDALLASMSMRSVQRTLPRGHPAKFLYEMVMSEPAFLRNDKKMAEFLNHPDVEGVYQMQMPLQMKMLMNVGCVTSISRHWKQNNRGFEIGKSTLPSEALQFLTTTTHPYLDSSCAVFRRIYLYHSCQDQRAVLALFFVDDTNEDLDNLARSKAGQSGVAVNGDGMEDEADADGQQEPARALMAEAKVWVVSPFKKGEKPPSLPRLFEHFRDSMGEASNDSRCKFDTRVVKDLDTAMAAATASLQEYISARNGPTVVVSQSTIPQAELVHAIPALNELPIVTMKSNSSDNNYKALGWMNFAAQRLVQRFLSFDAWWEERLRCSRYAHMPVGNMSDDFAVSMSDMFFARLLDHNNHLLWCSPTSKPDLGGIETDENDLWIEDMHSNAVANSGSKSSAAAEAAAAASNQAGSSGGMSICIPGAYRQVCVEFKLHGLAVNTVLASAFLQDLEGADGAMSLDIMQGGAGGVQDSLNFGGEGAASGPPGSQGILAPLDDVAACASSFRLLKSLVTNWFRDVSTTGNEFADSLLIHFYRWLCAGHSQMHDPALHRAVHRLMKKVFLQLMAELRQLGAEVVYATFDRVIICTNKSSRTAAEDYFHYIEQTVTSRELFSCLQFEVTTYWEQLFFMDAENFGGVVVQEDVDEEEEEEIDSDQEEEILGEYGGLPVAAGGDDSDDDDEEDENVLVEVEEEAVAAGALVGGGSGDEGEEDQGVIGHEGQEEPAVQDEGEFEEDGDRLTGRRTRSQGPVETDDVTEDSGEATPVALEDNLQIISHWNLADYLPEAAGEYFTIFVGEFIFKPVQYRQKVVAEHEAALIEAVNCLTQTQPDSEFGSQEATATSPSLAEGGVSKRMRPGDEGYVEYKCLKYQRELITNNLAKKLLHVIPDLQMNNLKEAFPELPGTRRSYFRTPPQFSHLLLFHSLTCSYFVLGSHLKMTDSALEFTKAVCQVFSLDKQVELEVRINCLCSW
jgi:DNA polymerase epsilon subunit 1